MSENKKVFGLLISHKEQEPLITAHCFGDCGKISMGGALMDEELGGILMCCHEPCPHLDKQMDTPIGTTVFRHERGDTTYDVFIRLIKAPAKESQ